MDQASSASLVLKPMRLAPMFAEALALLGRNFVLIYPVFLFFILASLLVPRHIPSVAQWRWEWWVVIVGLMTIYWIFQAGWYAMMFEAVTLWREASKSPPSVEPSKSVWETLPIARLKAFIPGMGAYGLPFLLGGMLSLVATVLPVALLGWLGYRFVGIPQGIWAFSRQKAITVADLESLIHHLSAAEKAQLATWDGLFLLALALVFLVQLLLLFWQPLVIIRQGNLSQAMWDSIRYVKHHPLRAIVILVSQTMLYLLFLLMGVMPVVNLLSDFFLILTIVYMGLFLFLVLLASPDVSRQTAA
jgi:hypothetical protein